MKYVWMSLIILTVLQLCVFLTTVYLHRGKTHRAVEFVGFVDNCMNALLLSFTGIVSREWVAWHRKHHAYPDRPGDPHSPYEHGMWKLLLYKNFLLYRRDTRNWEFVLQYTKDWKNRLIDRLPLKRFYALFGLLGFVGIASLFWGRWGIAYGFAAWLMNISLYILLNAAINSVCHKVGYRNFTSEHNKATNLKWVAWLTGGEGLHNNHHEFQVSPKFSHLRSEVNLGWCFIKVLEYLHLATVRPVPEGI